MDLEALVRQGWADHAADPRGVADRLAGALAAVAADADAVRVGALGVHVLGEHLGAWAEGLAFVDRLAALPGVDPAGPVSGWVRRWRACLRLAAAEPGALDGLDAADRARAGALAASAVALRDADRAGRLFAAALAEAPRASPADLLPVHRALAIAGNNLACTFEERSDRTEADTALMLDAARAARAHWAVAGTWLEVERAEYRLARSHLAAGRAAEARGHARACLDLVLEQPDPPAFERFFGWEALALAARALGDADGAAEAAAGARAAFEELPEGDRAACAAALATLAVAERSSV